MDACIARLDRIFALPLNVPCAARLDPERLVARHLADSSAIPFAGEGDGASVAAAIGQPLGPDETTLLTALAPFAANTPRKAKRFLNLYRLLRAEGLPKAALALAAATANVDDPERFAELKRAVEGESWRIAEPETPKTLIGAIQAARAAQNGDINVADMRAALEAAQRYRWANP